MKRVDRLTAILIHLQSKRVVRAKEIAARFGISLRTVYRDIRALENAGVPIGARAGEGYFIVEGYTLPPVMFTRNEAGALLLGGKLIDTFTDLSMRKQFESALYKIKSVLKAPEKEHVERLNSQIEIVVQSSPRESAYNDEVLSDLQSQVGQNRIVEITYLSAYKQEKTTRRVEPIGLCYWGGNWHLIAFCQLRNDYRDFRVSRIERLTLTENCFDETTHDSLRDLVRRMNTPKTLRSAVVRFDKELAVVVKNQKYYYGFVSESDRNGAIEMEFLVLSYRSFAYWLLTFLDRVEIVSPDELREILHDFSTTLFSHYNR